MCAVCGVLWEGFFVAVVNKKDLKQIEMGRSMQMIIDKFFAKVLVSPHLFFPGGWWWSGTGLW